MEGYYIFCIFIIFYVVSYKLGYSGFSSFEMRQGCLCPYRQPASMHLDGFRGAQAHPDPLLRGQPTPRVPEPPARCETGRWSTSQRLVIVIICNNINMSR